MLGTLHVPSTSSGKTTWSSLLRTTDDMVAFSKARGTCFVSTTIQVPIHPLDDFSLEGPCVLKIDAEGSELEVLKGATAVLGRCQLLLIELSVFHRWQGEGRFAEIVSLLHARGFELFDIPLLWYTLRNRDLTLIDAVFVPMADRRAGRWIE